jgi:hypothetical protein
VNAEGYSKGGCSGTKSSVAVSATMVNCDGDVCDNVALVKMYSGSCATSDTYSSLPYISDYCVAETDSSYKYSCAGNNITYMTYSGTSCSGTPTVTLEYLQNMECVSNSIYYEIECNADPAGSQGVMHKVFLPLLSIVLFTIVKLL